MGKKSVSKLIETALELLEEVKGLQDPSVEKLQTLSTETGKVQEDYVKMKNSLKEIKAALENAHEEMIELIKEVKKTQKKAQ